MRNPVRVTVVAVACGALAVSGGFLTGAVIARSAPSAAPLASGRIHPAAVRPSPTRTPAPTPRPAAPALQVSGAPSGVQAKAGALADAATGTLLWSRDLDTERPIASITKIMTALVVARAGDLNREIPVPKAVIPYVNEYGAESAGLHPGDILTAQELLEALLLPSGADAAYTLATAYGPGMTAFLAKMNATAQQLGMLHTHFTSPDGLPYPTEFSTYSTPADLITLGLAAMKSPVIASIAGQSFYQLPKGPGHHAYWWNNTNDLIGSYPGADGIKTGYTDAALHCLLFAATRDGLTLIGDVLGSPATGPASGADAAARVLNWGFSLRRS
jgi:serine-type D-Ala-D-Ala carboxypeptidase (penicillin-binding protein 5/6)